MLTRLPFGLKGEIVRSPMPFSDFDQDQSTYDAYRQNDITVVVVLASELECRERSGRDLLRQYALDGYEVIHLPIANFGIPDERTAFERALADTLDRARAGRNVAIHCLAGVGRTGLFSACLARDVLQLPAGEAIAWIRQFIPHAVETEEQRRFVGGDA